MKFTHLSIIIAALAVYPKQSTALRCGINGITEPCIGETDVRYDSDVSYDIKEQDDIWGKLEGLYVQESCEYEADGTKRTKLYPPNFPPEYGLGSYNNCEKKGFLNVTVDGSRRYYHRTVLLKHNGDGPGNMTLPGYVLPVDQYGVSTFEKNGEIDVFMSSVGYPDWDEPGLGEGLLPFEPPSVLSPIGGKSYLALTPQKTGDIYESAYCTDLECTKVNHYVENYSNLGVSNLDVKNGENSKGDVRFFSRTASTKVDKDTWMQEWSKAFIEYKIPPPNNPFTELPLDWGRNGTIQPFDPTTSDVAPECMTLVCPTEDDWKTMDPYLNTSPYIEPSGVLTGGFIAGITIGSIVLSAIMFYFIYKRGVEAREKRVKEAVMRSIAKSMTISTSDNLKPKDLEKMFSKIDVDGNGNLDKDEVKELVDEAGVANMSERDYNILFASTDLDGNGSLDFVEFCAFFASISPGDEFADN